MTQGRDAHDVTGLLRLWSDGSESARDDVARVVYRELRAIAHNRLEGEAGGQTLDTTDLVHEAYLKLADSEAIDWESRAHFFAIAARQMRQILVDRARGRLAQKRGGGARPATLDESLHYRDSQARALVEIDDALARLSEVSERAESVVEMRFFAGMTMKEIAADLGVSVATVERDWALARSWLMRELGSES